MTFIYELDPYSLQIHRMCMYELPTCKLSKFPKFIISQIFFLLHFQLTHRKAYKPTNKQVQAKTCRPRRRGRSTNVIAAFFTRQI